MESVRRFRQIDGRAAREGTIFGIGEIDVTLGPRQRHELAADLSFEEKHVLVLVIQDDSLQIVIQPIARCVKRSAMPFRADAKCRHIIDAVYQADTCVFHTIIMVGCRRSEEHTTEFESLMSTSYAAF